MEKVVLGRRFTLQTEPHHAIEIFMHFFINSSEPFTRESAKLARGAEVPGWRVTCFEGSVTLGAEPTFSHINTSARLPEATHECRV